MKVNNLLKFYVWLFNKKKPKDRILTRTNPDQETNQTILEQAKFIQSLEAQLSDVQAGKREKKVTKQNKEEEIELIKELTSKSKEIKKKKYANSYSLMNLYKRILTNKKFAEKLEICDKDDKVVFDKFKTFIIIDNGDRPAKLGILGKSGEVWAEGSCLHEIIFKPETIRNQIKRGRILLPYDEKFNYVPDLEKLQMPEISLDDDGKFNVSEERIRPFKQMIIERDTKIFELRKDKEHKEQLISDLRNSNRDLELAKNSWKSNAENAQSELSLSLANSTQHMNKVGEITRNLAMAQEQKMLSDEIKDKHESANEELMNQLEEDKSKTSLRRAKDEVQRDLETAKKFVPKEKEVHIVENKDNSEIKSEVLGK